MCVTLRTLPFRCCGRHISLAEAVTQCHHSQYNTTSIMELVTLCCTCRFEFRLWAKLLFLCVGRTSWYTNGVVTFASLIKIFDVQNLLPFYVGSQKRIRVDRDDSACSHFSSPTLAVTIGDTRPHLESGKNSIDLLKPTWWRVWFCL
jgi:hypothetical protein